MGGLPGGRFGAARAAALFAWVVACAAGFAGLAAYRGATGEPARAAATWPAASRLASAGPDSARLVAFLHPRCPCSRATLGEIERILARPHQPLCAVAVLVVPDSLGAAWAHTDLYRAAVAIPGLRVVVDPGGVEARRFGPFTSGQVLFYDTGGRLRFAGGVTPGRGHAGDNAGEDAVVALAAGGSGGTTLTPVFGCALWTPRPAGPGAPTP